MSNYWSFMHTCSLGLTFIIDFMSTHFSWVMTCRCHCSALSTMNGMLLWSTARWVTVRAWRAVVINVMSVSWYNYLVIVWLSCFSYSSCFKSCSHETIIVVRRHAISWSTFDHNCSQWWPSMPCYYSCFYGFSEDATWCSSLQAAVSVRISVNVIRQGTMLQNWPTKYVTSSLATCLAAYYFIR